MPLNGPAPVTGSFFSVEAMRSARFRVFADHELRVAQKFVRRHREIVGRGFVLVDAAREIEERAVTRTIEAAMPVRFERLRLRLQSIDRRAAEMGADADEHEIFGLERAE